MHKPPVSLEDRLDSMTEKEKNFLKVCMCVRLYVLTYAKTRDESSGQIFITEVAVVIILTIAVVYILYLTMLHNFIFCCYSAALFTTPGVKYADKN